MNKQEAIEKIKEKSLFFEDDYVGVITVIELGDVQKIISQIEEPQKIMVPKFVAEWIEDHKGDYNEWNEEARADFVFRAINDLFRFGDGFSPWDFTIDEKFSEWTTKNAYKFITAILFGYEIEQEKLYTVEIPNPNIIGSEHTVLVKNGFKKIVMVRVYGNSWKTAKGYHLTESEIKKDFDFLWQFAKPVEEK